MTWHALTAGVAWAGDDAVGIAGGGDTRLRVPVITVVDRVCGSTDAGRSARPHEAVFQVIARLPPDGWHAASAQASILVQR